MTHNIEAKNPYTRRKAMIELLKNNSMMSLEELKENLSDTSLSTVRRDALLLQSQGRVILIRGGIVKYYNANTDELPVDEKARLNKHKKERIAKAAAGYVCEGETIYIDSGTTTAMLLRYLRDMKITIVTSSTYIINDAARCEGNMIVLGGEVNKSIASISGPTTDRQMEELYFDRSFIGANGFSQGGGISTYDMQEASKKRIAHAHSGVTYILADSSKAGRSTLCRAFSLSDCIVITDERNETTDIANAVIAP